MVFAQQTDVSRSAALLAFWREYWVVLLPTALGFLVVYALLPRVRQSKQAWLTLAGALALIAAGMLLVHSTGIWQETLLFYSFSAIAIVGGVLLVTQSNPVYAALSFALVVLATCGLFLLNGAPFLSAATIIVYAGAIVVTFLFVIMLSQQSGVDNADLRSREPLLATIAGFVLLASLLGVLHRTFDQRELDVLAQQLDWLAQVRTVDEINKRYGEPEIGKMRLPFTEKLRKYFPETSDEDKNFATRLDHKRGRPAELREEAKKAHAALDELRVAYGTVAPHTDKPQKLKAENVAWLGQALFTTYLVPVELAAVLLLVATIGAIAIAGRREGTLR